MTRFSLCIAIICALAWSSRTAAAPHLTFTHVRYADAVIAAAIARGLDAPLFAELLASIERSDVIVYLERGTCRGRGTGMTEFLTAAGDVRYARITLNIGRLGDAEVALVGHELQHVVELAKAASVRDIRAYRELYESIGYPTAGRASASFETDAAQKTAWRILEQLRRGVSLPATH